MKHLFILLLAVFAFCGVAAAHTAEQGEPVTYPVGKLKPRDSQLKVGIGDAAPDFSLPSITGKTIRLSDYRGRKNVVLSFVPAAWTPVCSDQWPGYNIAREMFLELDAVLIGITVDNVPTLYAWSKAMNTLKFPVLSDFWPHGEVADSYGVLRGDGMAERAIFIIDKSGILQYIDVHDINSRPDLGKIVEALQKIQ